MRNIEIRHSSAASVATKFYRNCGKDYSNWDDKMFARAEAEVFGSWGANGSLQQKQREEKLKEWCNVNQDVAEAHKEDYVESQNIYAEAVSAWSSCIALYEKDVRIDTDVTPDNRSVAISLRYTGLGAHGVKLFGINSKNFKCRINVPSPNSSREFKNGDHLNEVFIGPQAISVHYERDDATRVEENGHEYIKSPSGFINVATASNPFQIFFPEEYEPPLPALQASRIMSSVRSLEGEINRLRTALEQDFRFVKEDTIRINNLIQTIKDRIDAVKIQHGAQGIGRSDNYAKRFTIKFPKPFTAPPRVIATADSHPNDYIHVNVYEVSRTEFKGVAARSNGSDWAHNQVIQWIAIQGEGL